MIGWVDNIETITLDNSNFRTVVYTAARCQLTLMSIPPEAKSGGKHIPTSTNSYDWRGGRPGSISA